MPAVLPLKGVRVLSLAQQYPGPFATAQLSDLGADVVSVERPGVGDPTRAFPAFHASLARGKRSIALDLKVPGGRTAFRRLVAEADVVVEGFRPGTMQRLGLSYASLLEDNPRLVHVSISGYGQSGPHRDRPGHDVTYQAEAGMLYEHLPPAGPPPPPTIAWGDLVAGMFAAQAVVTGILHRERSGDGCEIDVSMYDCLVAALTAHVIPVINGTGPAGFQYEPGYGVFLTADGRHLALGVAHEDHFWRALCDVAGLPEHRELPSVERFAHTDLLRNALEDAVERRSSQWWDAQLTAADVPFGWVRSLEELSSSAHARARGVFAQARDALDDLTFVRQPLVFDGVPSQPVSGVPRLGEHTQAVLAEAGFSEAEVAELLASGAASQTEPEDALR